MLAIAVILVGPSVVQAEAVSLVETTDFMHARYYSPNLGRFLSVDPVSGSIGSSQSWNRYAYVLNNPIGFVDPDGEAVFTLLALGAGGTALLKAAGVTVFVGSAVGTVNVPGTELPMC